MLWANFGKWWSVHKYESVQNDQKHIFTNIMDILWSKPVQLLVRWIRTIITSVGRETNKVKQGSIFILRKLLGV